MRRFYDGWRDEIDGIEFRCVRGRKSPDDLVIEMYTDSGWRRVTAKFVGVLVDFLYENEHVLYPPPRWQGGEKFLAFMRECAHAGYVQAVARLEREKREAKARGVPAGRRAS